MHQLRHRRIGEEACEIRAIDPSAAQRSWDDLNEMRAAIAGGKLHQAEPVPMRIKAHRLGVDRDGVAEVQAIGQIVAMEFDGRARRELGNDSSSPA
jgi:hypothetical protein